MKLERGTLSSNFTILQGNRIVYFLSAVCPYTKLPFALHTFCVFRYFVTRQALRRLRAIIAGSR